MAHPSGTTARVQRLSALVAIVLVAVAIGFAFGRILVGHGATYRMLAVGIASGVLAWATERRGMLLATAASAVALLLALTWLAVPHTAWYGLPTLETLRALGTLATQVGAQAREYVSPAPATPALIMAGAIAVWAAVFSCYALAFRAQSPLLSLVPPLALIVFADSVLDDVERPIFGVLFLIAAVAVLFADSLRRIRSWGPVWSPVGGRDRLAPVAGRNARRVGVTAVALAALAPAFVPGFGTNAVLDISRFGSDHRIRVSPLVSMGSILTDAAAGNDPPVFTVDANWEGPSDQPFTGTYWRMVVLDRFVDGTWEASPDVGQPLAGPSIQPAPPSGKTLTATFTVQSDQGFSWLFAAAEPTDITIDHPVQWHPASSSLQMDGWPDAGEQYTVTSVLPTPTVADLRGSDAAHEADVDFSLPADIPDVVGNTAEAWTSGLDTDYAKVMAIYQHLHDSPDFSYSLNVDYSDNSNGLADFLREKKGFCQQFAGLMAVMLRKIGIPARVALGFGAGTIEGPHTWQVSLKQYHAWVEVPFGNYGWLVFDPTPTHFSDPAASWVPSGPTSNDCHGPRCSDLVPVKTENQHDVKGGNTILGTQGFGTLLQLADQPPNDGRSWSVSGLVLPIALGLGLIIAIGIPLLHLARRRRRLHAARDPRELILARFDVFADRAADLGWGRAPGETPDEFRRRLASIDALGEDGREPLTRLTATVVRAAYGRADPDRSAVAEVDQDAATVLHRLRDTTSLKQRVLGLYRRD